MGRIPPDMSARDGSLPLFSLLFSFASSRVCVCVCVFVCVRACVRSQRSGASAAHGWHITRAQAPASVTHMGVGARALEGGRWTQGGQGASRWRQPPGSSCGGAPCRAIDSRALPRTRHCPSPRPPPSWPCRFSESCPTPPARLSPSAGYAQA